ncbi:lipoprotein [Actinoplanes sp. NBRC 14428]|nr:lipoprotein [Actinoplanes sp. NBRC 14428]
MMRNSYRSATVLRRGLLAGAAVTVTLVLSACGGSDHPSGDIGTKHGATSAASPAASAVGTFNDADVTFAQAMIPHHQQAVQMADLADGRAADAEVKELAGKIQSAQQPEIDTMTGWLTTLGEPAPEPHMSMGSGMDHGSMPGVMTDADMSKLMGAKGAAFDKHFLTMMISHHEGAIEMAETEVAQGSDPEAKALAQKIITDQQAEIATMKTILERL